MEVVEYRNFTNAILGVLQEDPAVLGMIALGSTADRAYRDQWSDHDFWIIAQPGRQEHYLDTVTWLPFSDQILLTSRQGQHVRTALYKSAHKVEYGVFDRESAIADGKIERFSVLMDRGGVSALAHSIRDESKALRQEETKRPTKLADLTMLAWTVFQLRQRGEWLAAHKNLISAMDLLLDMFQAHTGDEEDSRTDFLDPLRRIERLQPELAAELRETLTASEGSGIARLLRIAERELGAFTPELEWEQSSMVAGWIESAATSSG